MVSEGVDIPRLRVGVYATAAKTPLIFRQIVGRFVRTLPGRPVDMSWLYLPADPVLRAHAADVERELRHVLRPPSEADPFALDERRGAARDRALGGAGVRAAGRRRGAAARAVRRARRAAPPRRVGRAVAAPARGGAPSPSPSSPRRSSAARSCATSATASSPTCAGSDGRSHAEINRWLNRSCGIRRVEDASLDQLERSIDLLLGALSGRR